MLWAMSSAVTVSLYVPGIVCSGMNNCPVLMPARASQLSATGEVPSSLATSVRVLWDALAFRVERFGPGETCFIELDLDYGWLAGNDKGFEFAIGMADTVAQNQADRVGSVLHIIGRQKTRLPYILAGQIAQLLHQPEGKQRGDGADRFVRFYPQYGITGADDARTQERPRHRQE